MDKVEFNNACYEVLEILKYVKEEDLKKIPEEEIQLLKINANFNHNFKYDPHKSIKEQNISKLAKGMIATYFEKYTASEKQQKKIKLKRAYDLKIIEQEKMEKYKEDNIFKKEDEKEIVESQNENVQIIKIPQEKWYKRIISFFTNIFKKRRER